LSLWPGTHSAKDFRQARTCDIMEPMAEAREQIQQEENAIIPPWMLSAGCVLLFAAVSAVFFRGAWNPGNTIEGTDASLWLPMFTQKWTRGLFVPRWFPHFLAGIGQQFYFLSHGLPLILTLSPHRFHAFQFMLDTFLCGTFMFAFLRGRHLSRFGALVGGLAYQLGNNVLTNAAQGGLWKFETVCWIPLFLLFFCRVVEGTPGRIRNSIFAGAALGLQFLGGEVQLAYYVCLLTLAYFVFDSGGRLWDNRKSMPLAESAKTEGERVLWAALCAVLGIVFAAEVFCNYWGFAGENRNIGVRSEEDNWRFVTEWSFPPEETLSLALSGNIFASDTYSRGYMGQPIKRISDDYMGAVVLMFAFLSLFAGRRHALFWGCAAIVALLISYGRYFPFFFRLVYELPGMKGLRTPHKWLFMTALCVPILAGLGADFWKKAPSALHQRIAIAIPLFFGMAVLLLFLSPAITGATFFQSLVGARGPMIILAFASVICLIGIMKRTARLTGIRLALPIIIVALLVTDLTVNASKFIKYYDYKERFIKDDLVNWLRSQPKPFRVKLWSENQYLRYLTTEVLPYHGIDCADAILSRRPQPYSDFFHALREKRITFEQYFQLFNIKYVLSPVPLRETDMPVKLVTSFTSSSGDGSPEECHVYEFSDYLPRAYMVDRFETVKLERTFDIIGAPDFDLRTSVVLEKQPSLILGDGSGDPKWNIRDISQTPHAVSMSVTVDRPAILVFQDFMDENWKGHVDTEKVEVMRANYLMRAISVPKGSHIITFTYRPPLWGYTVTLIAWVVLISTIVYGAVKKFGGKPDANV
jgi:hypothetical protein